MDNMTTSVRMVIRFMVGQPKALYRLMEPGGASPRTIDVVKSSYALQSGSHIELMLIKQTPPQ